MNRSDIRQLFNYTEWANALVFEAATKLSEEQRRQDVHISHKSIFETLQHMAGAEWIWLERWHGNPPTGTEVWANWKAENPDMSTLQGHWQQVAVRRAAFLESLEEDRLMQHSPFTLVNGTSDTLPLAGQMQHVVNHATLHRGQVVGMIRQLGVTPPATDLIAYLRTKGRS